MLAVGDKVFKAGGGAVPRRSRRDVSASSLFAAPPATGSPPMCSAMPEPPVLLLHGGGQTRHAWRRTAVEIARAGRMAYAVDQRGHGDSEWVADGAYRFKDFADDVAALAAELTRRHGAPPVAIGASLGGIAALLAAGRRRGADLRRARAGRHHAARRCHRRRQGAGLHAGACARGFRFGRGSRGCGRGLSAAPAAAALDRRA